MGQLVMGSRFPCPQPHERTLNFHCKPALDCCSNSLYSSCCIKSALQPGAFLAVRRSVQLHLCPLGCRRHCRCCGHVRKRPTSAPEERWCMVAMPPARGCAQGKGRRRNFIQWVESQQKGTSESAIPPRAATYSRNCTAQSLLHARFCIRSIRRLHPPPFCSHMSASCITSSAARQAAAAARACTLPSSRARVAAAAVPPCGP